MSELISVDYQLPAFAATPRQDNAALINRVACCDALELLRTLATDSVDAVITDPPYGIGLDHWDVAIDIDRFMAECQRILKPTGFLAFFGQMPTMLDWQLAARNAGFKYRDHILWIKRMRSAIALPLMRTHESIFVYAISSASKYFKTDGGYSDIALPGYLHGLTTIDSIDRYIKDLRVKASGKTPNPMKRSNSQPIYNYLKGVDGQTWDRSPEECNFANVWSFLPENSSQRDGVYDHPTKKPLLLIQRLVELLTKPNELIVDCFSGSGTTALAARSTGRRFICGDKEQQYVDIANARLAQPYTPPLFADPQPGESAPQQLTLGEGVQNG